MDRSKLSPMMLQYLDTKKQYPDCILFFRVGDFYEMFFDDAKIGALELDLVLTGKECGMEERAPMCGVPYHAADNYISRLVKKGYKVAIGEQVEDPKLSKGIVKRSVIRVITPGTLIENDAAEDGRNNYLMSIDYQGGIFGISSIDIGTGEFNVTKVPEFREVLDELNRFSPSELICSNEFKTFCSMEDIKNKFNLIVSEVPGSYFNLDEAESILLEHFKAAPSGLGLLDMGAGINAAGAALRYVYDTQFSTVEHITKINPYSNLEYMVIDSSTMRNLELIETMRDKEKKGTLFWVLDKTGTAMGSRLLRRFITQPLLKKDAIELRQEAVAELCERFIDREELSEYLKPIYDLERLLSRFSSRRGNPLDLTAFKNSLSYIGPIKQLLSTFESEMLKQIHDDLDELSDLYAMLNCALTDDPPVSIRDGGIIRDGFNADVDKLKLSKTEGKRWLYELEAKEKESSGIKGLRIKYNKNFGYCIEVSNSFKDKVPEYFIRRQTLTAGERYTTPELEKLSSDILGADERLNSLEYDIFMGILEKISAEAKRIHRTASAIAYTDVLCSLSSVASKNRYVRPSVNEKGIISIKDGRHPVVELMMKESSFISNDTFLNNTNERIAVITGPNMAGKSTYMRQTALITLMAQIGSFVPAKSADIAICDKIFTRVGASDDLAGGQSTFMVEMTEVANILRKASAKSLLILDEIGRGTSTYDGLSIAWAVIEYISDKNKLGAKALFATHYHELTELEGKINGVKNYCILVSEHEGELLFLRKIIPGGADRSYGIAVAKLAGIPEEIILRASEIAEKLSSQDINNTSAKIGELAGNGSKCDGNDKEYHMPVPKVDKKEKLYKDTAKKIIDLDVNKMTPMEAIFILNELKEKLTDDKHTE